MRSWCVALTVAVDVPPRDREVLESWLRSPSIRAGAAQRARIVLLAADGIGTNEIARRVGCSKPTWGESEHRAHSDQANDAPYTPDRRHGPQSGRRRPL